jgi:nucleotide-binding universal stress UspA family protein
MTVAVAHQVSPTTERALTEAAREASFRDTRLAVIHVVDSLDNDIAAANEAGISDAVQKVLAGAGLAQVPWDLHLVAGGTEISDVAAAVLEQVGHVAPDLLVIGARRRSPMGKAFLGSVAQILILESDIPVLVVKSGK